MSKLGKFTGGFVGLIAVLVILLAVNVIVKNVRVRFDLTEENLYTLSEGTRSILSGLEKDVALEFYFTRSSAEVPTWLKSFANQIEDVLGEFKIAAGGRLDVKILDPRPDSDEEDWAREAGISGTQLQFLGPAVYIGVVARSGDQVAVLPALHPDTAPELEYNLIRLVHRAAHPEKPVIGVMSSLPVLGGQAPPFSMPGQPQPQPEPAWLLFRELEKDYDVRRLETSADEIDESIVALVLVHPKELSDSALFAIDQFLLRGGKLLVFLDPLSVADPALRSGGGQFGQRGSQPSSDLNRLLTAWGVTYNPAEVLADLSASTPTRDRGNDPTNLRLMGEAGHMHSNDLVTANLEMLHLPFAGTFGGDPIEGLSMTPLLSSSANSDMVSTFMIRLGPDALKREFSSRMMKLPLAVRLFGRFKTAFPDGPPANEDDAAEGEDPEDSAPPNLLIESLQDSAVILVGDVDMLLDDVCIERFQVFGSSAYRPRNDNINFFANAVEQLAGSTDLIGVRTRGQSVRPFEVVDRLELQAQERWLQEEQVLQTKLNETRQRLRDLQTAKDPSQHSIISPEQEAAIKRFRKEETDTAKKLKNVRKELRRDIDRLGAKLKAINIVLMPVLVGISGIAFGLYRRSRVR